MSALLTDLPFDLQKAATQRNLAAEQVLFRQGDRATDLYVVEKGRLQLIRHTVERQITPIEVVRSGECLGEAVFADPVYSCTAIAEVPTEVWIYPKNAVLTSLQQNHHLAELVIVELLRKNRLMRHQLAVRSIRASDERVLHYLQILVRDKQFTPSDRENVICFDRPLKRVAAELGLTPEAFSRALTKLEQQGMIQRSQRCITLCNAA